MIKNGYTDIHMHVIPYADDGAEDFDDALNMLRIAYDEGIRRVIATPHSAAFDLWRNRVRDNFALLKEKVAEEGIDIKLSLGSEIFITPDNIKKTLRRIKRGKYPTLADTNKVLIEFELCERDYKGIAKSICGLIESGYMPVIAHAERYQFSIDQIYELAEIGCMLQINFEDVIPVKGDFMSEKANIMLKDEMVSFIATDAHGSKRRTPHIKNELEYIWANYESEYIDNIVNGMFL